jgi:hypothetical protein
MEQTDFKVRIESNGEPYGTHVFNDDTGEEMTNVVRIEIHIDSANLGIPQVTLELWGGGRFAFQKVKLIHE